ncbi:MAG TPA: hypothetical protein VGB53_16120 [Rubricoccaceae bacterium]
MAPPFAEMLRKVRPPAPINVFTTLSATPPAAVIVLAFVPVPTVTAPPPVALKPVPVVVVIASPPPVKLTAAPLARMFTALADSVVKVFVAPVKAMLPPVFAFSVIPLAALFVFVSVPA